MTPERAALDLASQIEEFGKTALCIKAERDALAAALRDIVLGAEIMLQSSIGGALASYAMEVQRVAYAALHECKV
jgi:hypothetical protein